MTWLAVKIFFDKAVLWCKKYWQILLGISIPLIIMVITAGRRNDLKKALEVANEKANEDRAAMEESHKLQLEAKEEEIRAKEEASAELVRRIHEIETTHRVNVSDLNRKQKKELDDLLSSDSDATEVSEKLADLFGTDVKS